MHYFVDGYNLLFRSRSQHDNFQKQREQVIADLADAVTALKLDLTVVFDSTHTTELSSRHHKGPLEIIYTQGKETADHLILRALEDCDTPKRETVVTSDKPLAEAARRLGAKSMDVESFLNWLRARYRTKSKRAEKLTWVTTKPKLPPPKLAKEIVTPPTPATVSHDYLTIFEQRLNEATKPDKVISSSPQPRKRKRKPQATKTAPEPDHDRWLRVFEARINEDSPD